MFNVVSIYDESDLVQKKLIEKKEKGPDTHYVLARYGKIWRDIQKKMV